MLASWRRVAQHAPDESPAISVASLPLRSNVSIVARKAGYEVLAWLTAVVRYCPGATGRALRRAWFGRTVAALGDHARIYEGVEIVGGGRIVIGDRFTADRGGFIAAANGGRILIGDDVTLGANTVIDASDDGVIELGNGTGIAFNSILRSSAHRYDDPDTPWRRQGHAPNSIVVEEDVWIASNVVLLPGTHVERGCVVAAGSVVGGRVSAFSVIAGNPARAIGKRDKS